jgi:hypothetical protein
MSDSTFKMTTLSKQVKREKLTLKSHGIKGHFNLFTGKSGEYWVSIFPALNTSGYGKTEEEAQSDLKYNLNLFCKDLFSLKPEQRIAELKKMGWHNDKLFRKQFSSAFVDENGVLQNFDFPTEVKKTSTELEAA